MGQILDVAIAARGLALAATVFAIGKIRQNRTHRAPAPHRRVTAARRMNSPIAAYAAASLKWSERRDLNSRPPVPQTGALTRLRHAPIPVKGAFYPSNFCLSPCAKGLAGR